MRHFILHTSVTYKFDFLWLQSVSSCACIIYKDRLAHVPPAKLSGCYILGKQHESQVSRHFHKKYWTHSKSDKNIRFHKASFKILSLRSVKQMLRILVCACFRITWKIHFCGLKICPEKQIVVLRADLLAKHFHSVGSTTSSVPYYARVCIILEIEKERNTVT